MPQVTGHGEETVFFSIEGEGEQWRLMEKVAAALEGFCRPPGEQFWTFSTAKVTDIVGAKEQVDVAYSYVPNPEEAFSFVEVRHRGSRVQRPYVQEVMGKKRSLRIADCCIVSPQDSRRTQPRWRQRTESAYVS